MKFDKSKIMSTSVPNYLRMNGYENLKQAKLEARGVHATAENPDAALDLLAERAPYGTQAIVEPQVFNPNMVYMVAVALASAWPGAPFKPIINEKGDYTIMAERIRNVELDHFDSRPYTGYSQESFEKIKELKAKGKVKFDGPGTRLAQLNFDEGNLSLSLGYTTYGMFLATRNNTDNFEDNARWLGCSGITVTKDNDDYFMWVGEKNPKANEIGGGQIQLTPAGGVDPFSDFGLATTVKRELHEEALTKKVFDLRVDRNLAIEMFGERRFIQKGDLYIMDRGFLEVESRIKLCQPYLLADMNSISSLNLVHLLRLDYSKKEVEESFEAIPEEEREFTFLVPLEFKQKFLEDYLNDKHDNLRPHLRAALDSVIRNWDYVNEELRKVV